MISFPNCSLTLRSTNEARICGLQLLSTGDADGLEAAAGRTMSGDSGDLLGNPFKVPDLECGMH
jgi:hypothetical protein